MSQPKMAAKSMIRSSVMPRLAGGAQKLDRISPFATCSRNCAGAPRRTGPGHEAVVPCGSPERLLQAVGVIEAVQLALFGELEGELLSRLQRAQDRASRGS